MFGLSLGHLIILLVVVLLFGSRRLPELGSALGRGLRAFKKGLDGLDAPDDSANRESLTHQNKDKDKDKDSGQTS